MATLTFLRLGKEIHDDLEDFLADHLAERQSAGIRKCKWRLRRRCRRILTRVVERIGFGALI